jgi:hypothetical protein
MPKRRPGSRERAANHPLMLSDSRLPLRIS